MSDAQNIAQEFEFNLLINYTVAAAYALWFYDFLLTLPAEISTVWPQKKNFVSAIYFLNRYTFLLYSVSQFLLTFGGSVLNESFCYWSLYPTEIFQLLSVFATGALFTLRVYAIYNQSVFAAFLPGLIVLARLALDFLLDVAIMYGYLITGPLNTGLLQGALCGFDSRSDSTRFKILRIVLSFLTLLFDIIVFVMTLAKTWRQARDSKQLGLSSITHIIIRDGTMYFFLSLIVGIGITVTDCLSLITQDDGIPSYFWLVITPFLNILPNILAGRLFLNLKVYASRGSTLNSNQIESVHLAPLSFRGHIPRDGVDYLEESGFGSEATDANNITDPLPDGNGHDTHDSRLSVQEVVESSLSMKNEGDVTMVRREIEVHDKRETECFDRC